MTEGTWVYVLISTIADVENCTNMHKHFCIFIKIIDFHFMIVLGFFQIFSKVDPSMFEKVSLILGDCTEPMLGLSITDQKVLQENVTIIIHCAATVRFDEQMQQAVSINVTATKDLLILSKKLKNLKVW